MQLLEQLVTFLKDPKEEVRKQALEYLLSFTTDPEALEFFRRPESKVIVQLQALCHDKNELAHDAFKCLINISAEPDRCCEQVRDREFLWTLVKMIVHPNFLLADMACMLLSNLTKQIQAVRDLLQIEEPKLTGLFLAQLLEVFCRGPAHNAAAEFHFLASVFANVTTTQAGRDFFLTEQPHGRGYPLAKLLIFTEHQNLVRRGGVISTVKNCCFDVPRHGVMLSETSGLNILVPLLLPLAGPEELKEEEMEGMPEELQLLEPTKTRESDPCLRKMLVESLLSLTTTRGGRDIMRLRKVYPIIRELHLSETDEDCDALETELVQMLMREEDGGKLDNVEEIQEVLLEKAQ